MKNRFTIEEVIDFWDKVSDIYDGINENIGSTHYQRFTEGLKFLKLQDGDKVLNVWSRTGGAVQYIKNSAQVELYNLEVAPKMMERAKAKFPDSNFELTDLKSFNFPDIFFDSVLSLETLEHAPEPEEFLKEIFRVLKPGGRLVMSLPPQTAELPLRIYELFKKNHGEGPHRFLPSKIVKKLLKQVGFEIIIHKGTLLVPAGPAFFQKLGERLIEIFQSTPLKEMGIRQFYVANKPIK